MFLIWKENSCLQIPQLAIVSKIYLFQHTRSTLNLRLTDLIFIRWKSPIYHHHHHHCLHHLCHHHHHCDYPHHYHHNLCHQSSINVQICRVAANPSLSDREHTLKRGRWQGLIFLFVKNMRGRFSLFFSFLVKISDSSSFPEKDYYKGLRRESLSSFPA